MKLLLNDREFEIREYLDYAELKKLDLYRLMQCQFSIQKFLPKTLTNPAEIKKFLTEKFNQQQLSESEQKALTTYSLQMQEFNLRIDELIIISPKMTSLRMTTINDLKALPEYQQTLKAVWEDIMGMLTPQQSTTVKNV